MKMEDVSTDGSRFNIELFGKNASKIAEIK